MLTTFSLTATAALSGTTIPTIKLNLKHHFQASNYDRLSGLLRDSLVRRNALAISESELLSITSKGGFPQKPKGKKERQKK